MVAQEKVIFNDKHVMKPHNSAAVKAGGLLFCSGQVGHGEIGQATKDALQNLKEVLELAGSSLDKVVKFNIFIGDMKQFAEMNKAFVASLPEGPKPARTCVQPAVLPGFDKDPAASVEIEAIAEL
ncbi:hypothetical protein Q5752_001113 [Cryptotrichosporon argae]